MSVPRSFLGRAEHFGNHETMIIENATAREFAAIGELNVEAYSEFAPHITAEAWKTMQINLRAVEIVATRAQFLIVRARDALAGSVAYCPAGKSDPAIFAADCASVLLLAVSPRCRRQGIARALVDACLQRARHDGARSIGLFTSELMLSAQRIYRSVGFQEDGEIPRRLGLRYWRYRLDFAPRK